MERTIRPLSLTPRLLAIASLIRPDDRVLDIGTDHARLPVYLMERGLCAAVTATDIAEGPLERARRTVRAHRLESKVRLLLADGADGLDPEGFDVVTVTGMGGDSILSIVVKSPWLAKKRLILQPQTRVARFIEMMAGAGCAVTSQIAVAEGRRQYMIFITGDS